MKTIITTLPIYDKLIKQCFERGKHAGGDRPIPIICPRHKLPSFQWLDGADGAASVTKIETIDINLSAVDITAKFTLPTMIPLAHDYFTYSGDALLSLLTVGTYYLKITMNNAKVYYSDWFQVDCVFTSYTGVVPDQTYSSKYLQFVFYNGCDLGDIYYHGGFAQYLWLPSEAMEPSFPIEEEGVKNGEGQFVRTFARQVKKYLLRTKEMPDYMVDVFNRMKLHSSIQLTDLVGDAHGVYNLEVEHEWIGTDKYYAKLDLTFDYNEAVVIAGCCNNIS
jgi:hypothetical protein